MIDIHYSVDTRSLGRTLAEYVKISKKDMVEVINRTARAIAFELLKLTKRTDKQSIISELGKIVTKPKTSKSGKTRNTKHLETGTPLIYKIINARRGKQGKPGLTGAPMEKASLKLLGSRFRSITFGASGWVGDIKDLQPFVKGGGSISKTGVKQYGQQKGHATPAREGGNTAFAIIQSDIVGRETQSAFATIINKPVQQAINNVEADKMKYLERKQKEASEKFNSSK